MVYWNKFLKIRNRCTIYTSIIPGMGVMINVELLNFNKHRLIFAKLILRYKNQCMVYSHVINVIILQIGSLMMNTKL